MSKQIIPQATPLFVVTDKRDVGQVVFWTVERVNDAVEDTVAFPHVAVLESSLDYTLTGEEVEGYYPTLKAANKAADALSVRAARQEELDRGGVAVITQATPGKDGEGIFFDCAVQLDKHEETVYLQHRFVLDSDPLHQNAFFRDLGVLGLDSKFFDAEPSMEAVAETLTGKRAVIGLDPLKARITRWMKAA